MVQEEEMVTAMAKEMAVHRAEHLAKEVEM